MNPHAASRVLIAGASLESARGALILLHGRGSAPEAMRELGQQLAPADFAIIAPQAYEYSWYPHRFIRPRQENEPKLSSALALVDRLVENAHAAGIPNSHLVIGGFSQGACLALDYAARHPRRYGAILGFSGGLIGDAQSPLPIPTGTLSGTPVFIGVSERDPHIPLARAQESARIFEAMHASVMLKIYAGNDHIIRDDEITQAVGFMQGIDPL